MARIRSVHPGLFTDEAWVSCAPLTRILYIGLWTDADDQGLFEWKPLQIKMRLLPGDTGDAGEMLAELSEAGLIAPFEHGGKRFGAIKSFRKYQRPKKPNAVHPLPPEWVEYVGLSDGSTEPERDDAMPIPNQGGTEGEIAPQMEDGGGRVEEEGRDASASLPPPVAGRRARRRDETAIPEGYPDDAAITEAQKRFREAGCNIDARMQAERFRNHAQQIDRRCRDWAAAWRNWGLKAVEDAPKVLRPAVEPVALHPFADAEIRAAFVAERDEAWVRAWIDPCEWRDWDRTIVPKNGVAATRILQECRKLLRSLNLNLQAKAA